ncbi:hypothetical protein HNR73_003423 [Phytomonospora endophytica]|uniref:Uncharacterized protein n=1 Tax=Phytomonospora endophytica TaxID=714109 RepID=A0A841FSQ8_9ACTN|nr:hypothetical protein [Phytomonospora endophytica]GIG70078.1 hypothetical protein Pen01_63730 [Phytomonospora endophytica]
MLPPVEARKLTKVPFVEMADGRLQGVVSSGSDPARVYVSSIGAAEHGLGCSTNNNRPCGGLGGRWACNHIKAMVDEAVKQYGPERVGRFLGVEADEVSTGRDLLDRINGTASSTPAAVVFARFLRHLTYLELPSTSGPIPELHWFPATGGAV